MTDTENTQEKKAPAKKANTVACRLLRDYWPTEDGRVKKGEIIDLEVNAAFTAIEKGLVERVKS